MFLGSAAGTETGGGGLGSESSIIGQPPPTGGAGDMGLGSGISTPPPSPASASPMGDSTIGTPPADAPLGDDLTKIEGIGPKISQVLQAAGVSTFAELATMTADQVREKIISVDSSLGVHNPSTWPEQARLAASGDWDRLKMWQDELQGGIDVSNTGVTELDDLTKIEGIGPKICQVLQSSGVRTFADLAGLAPERVHEIMTASDPGLGVHNPMTWPDQARLAAAGEWDKLKELQDELQGGL